PAEATSGSVQYVTLKGLSFRHSGYLLRRTWIDDNKFTGGYNDSFSGFSLPATITVSNAHHIVLDDLEIAHTGAAGVWLRGGSEHISLTNSRLFDLGASGIKVVEYDPQVAYDLDRSNLAASIAMGGDHVIENNVIQSGGRSFYDATGILLVCSANNHVTHNDVGDFY